jgi:hypothetical protein
MRAETSRFGPVQPSPTVGCLGISRGLGYRVLRALFRSQQATFSSLHRSDVLLSCQMVGFRCRRGCSFSSRSL